MKIKNESACPKCGGPALEHPIARSRDPLNHRFWTETLQCSECGEIWDEEYCRLYIGYTHNGKFYESGDVGA